MAATLSNVVAIAAGYYRSLGLTAEGTVIGWGAGGPGQQGWRHAGQTAIPAGLSNVVTIAAGLQNRTALKCNSVARAGGEYLPDVRPPAARRGGGRRRIGAQRIAAPLPVRRP